MRCCIHQGIAVVCRSILQGGSGLRKIGHAQIRLKGHRSKSKEVSFSRIFWKLLKQIAGRIDIANRIILYQHSTCRFVSIQGFKRQQEVVRADHNPAFSNSQRFKQRLIQPVRQVCKRGVLAI